MTPLMIAAQLGRVQNCTVILELAKKMKLQTKSLVNRVDGNNYTSLHYAAEGGHPEIINTLQRFGADLDKPLGIKCKRMTPLMLTCRLGHFKAAEALLKCGAKIEIRDSLGRTGLMHGALNGHYPLGNAFVNSELSGFVPVRFL